MHDWLVAVSTVKFIMCQKIAALLRALWYVHFIKFSVTNILGFVCELYQDLRIGIDTNTRWQ